MRPFDTGEIDRLLSTTKSVRRRLDLERPVDRAVVQECIALAAYAPNASNSQEWKWVVSQFVDDQLAFVRDFAEQIRPAFD